MIQVDNRWYLLETRLEVLDLVPHPEYPMFGPSIDIKYLPV